MVSKEQRDYLTLYKSIMDTGAAVVRMYTESKCKSKYGIDFATYLESEKHYFYHQWEVKRKKPFCCGCPPAGCNIPKTGNMNNKMFTKWYKFYSNIPVPRGHMNAQQFCICQYTAQNLSIEELDLSDLKFLLKNTKLLSQADACQLEIISTVRNSVCHAVSTNMFTENDLKDLRLKFETSTLQLTEDPNKRMVKMLLQIQPCISNEDVEQLMKEISDFHVEKNRNMDTDISTIIKSVEKSENKIQHHFAKVWSSEIQNMTNKVVDRSLALTEDISQSRATIENSIILAEERIKKDLIILKQQIESDINEITNELPNCQINKIDDTTLIKVAGLSEDIGSQTFNISAQSGELLWLEEEKNMALKQEDLLAWEDNGMETMKNVKGYLYQLPFSYGIECIVDKRLDTVYSQIIRDIHHQTNQGHLGSCFKDETMDQFYRMYFSSVVPPHDLKDVLLTEISKGKNLYFRWLLSNTNVKPILEDVLAAAIHKNNIEIVKALSWKVVNIFFSEYKDELRSHSAIWLWPGFICKCQGKDASRVCSSQFVIIIETACEIKNIPKQFLGFNIKQYLLNREYTEAMIVTNTKIENWENESLVFNCLVTGTVAEELFHYHSNLTLICQSFAKSSGMSKNHKVSSLCCIQLFCSVKGIIPIGDNHFPSYVSGYPTDVLEGCPKIGANRITVGEKIGTIDLHGNFERQGTLGGFIKHFGYDCFMTCAHVAFDVKSLLSRVDDDIDDNGVKIYIPSPNSLPPVSQCGQVLKRVFEHDDKDKTSIDVALVHLQNSFYDPNILLKDPFGFGRPMSYIGLTSVDLRRSWIDLADICNSKVKAFCPGALSNITDVVHVGSITDSVEIKFSTPRNPIPTGAFQLLWCSNCHMQLHAGYLCDREVYRMYNQLLLNIPLQVGDSGTCIYVQTDKGKTGCIGMAIAFGPGGYSIVTPMKEILKKLKY